MNDYNYNILLSQEPVGFLVYIQMDDRNLSLGEFCEVSELGVLDVMKIITSSSGFKPEPNDAIGFFLFEEGAKRFIDAIQVELKS